MEMAPIGIEGGSTLTQAAHDHRRHVGQRQGENQQRQQQAHAGEPLRWPHDADRRQGETQEIGAAIAHEDAGGVEVVAEKTEAAPRQGRRQQAGGGLVKAEAHREQANRGNAAHSGGQSVQAIEPVDRVGDAHQPDHRGQHTEPAGQHQQGRLTAPGERQLDRADPHPFTPNHQGDPELQNQPGQGWQGEQVVGQTDRKKTEAAGQGGPDELVLAGLQFGKAPEQPGEHQGQAEPQHDAYATKAHHWPGVLFAGIGGVREAPVQTQATHNRHNQRREQHRHHEGEQGCRVGAVGEGQGCWQTWTPRRRASAVTLRALSTIRCAGAHGFRRRGGSGHTRPPPARGSAARWRRHRG